MKKVLILISVLAALVSKQLIADEISGGPRINMQSEQLTVPCVKVDDPGSEFDGRHFDVKFKKSGNSFDFIFAEEEEEKVCTKLIEASLNADTDTSDVNGNFGSTGALAVPAECTPAVIVIRHAEDMNDSRGEECDVVGKVCMTIPVLSQDAISCSAEEDSCQCVHQHCLTSNGQLHAQLYADYLEGWMTSEGLCPISKIITQDPWTTSNDLWPSANPFETSRELANKYNTPITFMSPDKEFRTSERKELITDSLHSTLISWDKEGLYDSSYPLLQNMTTEKVQFPDRDRVYVFTNMEPDTAKFDLDQFRQYFQDSEGYFQKVLGTAYSPDQYYRFDDGFLRSNQPYSKDLAVSKMLICASDCGGQGVTILAGKRQ